MESNKAQKLIEKILSDLDHAGIIINTLVDDLKELRTFAKKEEKPLLVKVLRLTYEHIEENETFEIPIPDDEPIEDEDSEVTSIEHNAVESLHYLISLFKDTNNKVNISDLKAYRDALNNY